MIKNLKDFFVNEEYTLNDVMKCIDKNAKNIALVVDNNCRLIYTLTDGDIRRAIIEGFSLDKKIKDLIDHYKFSDKRHPITANFDNSELELLNLMKKYSVRQLPILNKEGIVVGLVIFDDLIKDNSNKLDALIMAGGYGTRLSPLTQNTPKSMLPIGDQPLLQRIINNLKKSGINNINISMHYKSEVISEYFGDGNNLGININYVSEEQPLGTAGSIRDMENTENPVLVINGDILTNVDFKTMLNFHIEHNSDLTVAVRQYDYQVPYGVLESNGVKVTKITEKPVYQFYVSAGIYLIESNLICEIPKNKKYDMTDMINDTLGKNKNVTCFPIIEYWLDIGKPEDYEKAQIDILSKKLL